MSAVAQLLIQFIALEPGRTSEFITWLMARGDFSLPVKTACLLLKTEATRQLDALDTEDDFTAEALSQAAALLEGEG